ncbi:serum response factor-binding protein 1 isoform X2 [Folsomia candida]|uniref:Serum response factor-binding protein 1 n=1 Tax=Folsomia candida TaxID=158441 RepID=A0A226F496_FOLCA|nr:serum response factor-binding protein 1 isoform X2 [Folsomia candida]OXA64615.1 Serum response factor-binding protein 1 [Folsomia candida]
MGDDADGKVKRPVELTKKQELNNHIVLMRKVVRTARVHIINKLTKDIKKLKERKGDEKALEKTKRKIERFLQEIQVIKHLQEDKISIFSLQDKTKLEQVLQNPQSSTQDRALSRFSHHKLIQTEVSKYKTHNPYWELQIPVLLERSKDKRRRINKKLTEREAEREAGKNKNKNPNTIGGESLSSNNETDEESERNLDINDSDSEESVDQEESEREDKASKVNIKTEKKSSKPNPSKKTNPVSATEHNKVVKNNKKSTKSVEKPNNKKPPVPERNISKSVGTLKVQHLKDLTDLENSETFKPTEVKLTVDDLSHVPKLRIKSSFFVGGVDEAVEEPHEQQDLEKKRGSSDFQKNRQHNSSSEFKPVFKKGKLVNRPAAQGFKGGARNPPSARGKNTRYFDSKGRGGSDGGDSNLTPLGNRSDFKKNDRLPHAILNQKVATAEQSEKLHPSWEAKKRQQPILSAFKGKKTKFDNDDE